MKRINVLVITLVSFSLFFTACGDKDKDGKDTQPDATSPVITFKNNDTLYLNLGEKSAVSANVTATDDVDGDITKSIIITPNEFNALGYVQITYTVSDAAGNKTTKTRDAVVKSGKLAGKYAVNAIIKDSDGSFLNYEMQVTEQNNSELYFVDFHKTGSTDPLLKGAWKLTFVGDGSKKLKMVKREKIENPHDGGDNGYDLTGEAIFETVPGKTDEYQLVSMVYRFTPRQMGTGKGETEFAATCTRIP